MEDLGQPKPTTSKLQYVDAADYNPTASEPYADAITVPLGESSDTLVELKAHLVIEPNKVYHYRIVAENLYGTFATPDHTVETYPASGGALPDGRAYEQVSPVAKNNLDALGQGEGMTMQASPSSQAPAFAFFSFEPFPPTTGTEQFFTDYLSTRTSSPEWLTRGVQAPIEPSGPRGGLNEVVGFTEDLAKTIARAYGPPVGTPGAENAYVRDNATGSYQLIADVGGTPMHFVAASHDDSRILFETEHQVVSAAVPAATNLYEWDESKPEGQRVSLAGVLPGAECGCAPSGGSVAGPGNIRHTISDDGSKIFFTARPSGVVYEREPLSEPSPVTVPVSVGAAKFMAATPSGRYVFYSEGGELYRFDTLSETRKALSSGAEDVLGGLGVSDDGSYAYFVANGVLAANENANEETATTGAPNLYEWHEDTTAHTVIIIFIARLFSGGAEGRGGDQRDWLDGNKQARMNPSGTALLFTSRASLTGYDNGSLNASACGRGKEQFPCPELFLYSATEPLSSVNPACISCNPSGATASADTVLTEGEMEVALPGPKWTVHPTRNLSADGNRVFFETAESLITSDINGVSDVYEWERGGTGSCPSGQAHCLYLISTGTAHAKSFFGDAAASGNDVFFFTRQPLVAQDDDLNYDVYDARVGGGIAAQDQSTKPCEGEKECKPPVPPAPLFGTPGSATLVGVAGPLQPVPVVPPTSPKCAGNQKLRRGKCVVVKCPPGRKLSHGKCIKARSKTKARGRKAAARRGK
jgi:hypothetical protein